MEGLDTPQIDLLKGKELHPDGQAVKGAGLFSDHTLCERYTFTKHKNSDRVINQTFCQLTLF